MEMNIALIVISLTGVFLYVFYLISKLDRFIENGGFSDIPQDYVLKDVLVLADTERIPDIQAVEKKRVRLCEYTCEPSMPEHAVFKSVYALSRNDMDNILLCAQAQKAYRTFTVAMCNNRQYLSVFQNYHIDRVVFSLSEAYILLNTSFYGEGAGK